MLECIINIHTKHPLFIYKFLNIKNGGKIEIFVPKKCIFSLLHKLLLHILLHMNFVSYFIAQGYWKVQVKKRSQRFLLFWDMIIFMDLLNQSFVPMKNKSKLLIFILCIIQKEDEKRFEDWQNKYIALIFTGILFLPCRKYDVLNGSIVFSAEISSKLCS